VQAQAGAQAISDGAALGILFSNFNATDADSISARLTMYQNARFNKATVMQKLSDTEMRGPAAVREAVKPYMPGENVPCEYFQFGMRN
jgi:salicylate hydroxylase